MTEHWLDRTKLLIGEQGIEKLRNAHVLVAGLGGVGSFAAEFICRAGVGTMTIVDSDTVHCTNRNRQLLGLIQNEGKHKVDLMAQRLREINPEINLFEEKTYLIREEIPRVLNANKYDYVVDAIDTLSPKIFFIHNVVGLNLKLVSSFGSGARLDPSMIKVADISESNNCKLAYYVRKKLHKLGIRTGFKVVFSPEDSQGEMQIVDDNNKKSIVGTISYMPAIYGGFCASVVIRDLLDNKD